MKKYISIIGSKGIPAKYGGFETFAEQVTLKLSEKIPLKVYCSSNDAPSTYKDAISNVLLYYIKLPANGPLAIFYDLLSLLNASKDSHTILVLGSTAGFCLPIFRLLFKLKIIYHPDGLEWTRKKWNWAARLYLWLSNYLACCAAHRIILDNVALERTFGSFKEKWSHIGYGGDHSKLPPPKPLSIAGTYWLTITRAEPENQLDLIADAIIDSNKKWRVICNYMDTNYGKDFYRKYSNHNNISIYPPCYDQEELAKQRAGCIGYLHAHQCGGTNPSLVEAMYAGLPIVCHLNEFNFETTHGSAIYFSSKSELSRTIKNIDKEKLRTVGKLMESIAKESYTWEKMSKKLLECIYN